MIPDLSDVTTTHTIRVGDKAVAFVIGLVSASRLTKLYESNRDGDEFNAAGFTADLLAEAVRTAQLVEPDEADPQEFTRADAEEVANDWPPFARRDLYAAVEAWTHQGDSVDPKDS